MTGSTRGGCASTLLELGNLEKQNPVKQNQDKQNREKGNPEHRSAFEWIRGADHDSLRSSSHSWIFV